MAEDNNLREQLLQNFAPGDFFVRDEPFPLGSDPLPVNLIAFYLPAFHQNAENDAWWGKGFTEWTNVTKALPQFEGHYQPRLPGELGFYDLSNASIIKRQAVLARKWGIYGFCFHHYWFNGRRLLETPLNLFLDDQDIDINFCICWANDNWTRRWDGLEDEILLAQSYSPEDDFAFARAIMPIVKDRRYIHINGRPLILIYRPDLLPDALATTRRWRVEFAAQGCADPYLVAPISFGVDDPRLFGFDAGVEFPPHRRDYKLDPINDKVNLYNPQYKGQIFDYDDLVRNFLNRVRTPFKLFRAVAPSWDNEAIRSGRGLTYANATPDKYSDWLSAACRDALQAESEDERLVFVNSWNEWGEGAYLEPDRHFGYAYLKATAKALNNLMYAETKEKRIKIAVISHDAYLHGAQMLCLHIVQALVRDFDVDLRVLLAGPGELIQSFAEIAPIEMLEGRFSSAWEWEDLAKRLKVEEFDAVICNTVLCGQHLEFFKKSGLRTVLLIHELPGLIEQLDLVEAARNAALHSDVLVFPSDFVRSRFEEIIAVPEAKVFVRPQGVYITPPEASDYAKQRTAARRSLGAKLTDRIILGVGYGDYRKGIDLWPQLIKRVLSCYGDVLFVWVGRIDENIMPILKRDLEESGLKERLRIVNPTRQLQPLYAAADLFLLTSREDPFPNVALEAMAHGLPVLAFESSTGIAGLISESGAALSPMEDLDAMAKSCLKLLRDEALRVSIANKGKDFVSADFDFKDYVSDLLALARQSRPTVSVIVPNYNYGKYLSQRIASITSQSYPIHEILFLDDASTDNSLALIEDLKLQSAAEIKVIVNPVNSGSVSRQWYKGASMATGDLIWIAEADDFADPDFLSQTSKAFADSRVVLSYCQSRQVDAEGNVLANDYLDYVADIDPQRWRLHYHRPGRVEIAEALSVKNTIPNVSAVLFRRQTLIPILEEHLDEMCECQNAADWLCYLWLLREGHIAFTASSLNNHRRHKQSLTIAANDQRHLDEIAAMQRLATALAPVTNQARDLAQRWHALVEQQFGLTPTAEGAIQA
jgi:glycosyltransferase involved in cell wall biosynthesis